MKPISRHHPSRGLETTGIPRLLLTGLALMAILSAACRETARERHERSLANAGEPARHAIQSLRLREWMQQVVALHHARLPQALDLRLERERRIREVQSLARALAESARLIPRALTEIQLTPARDREFRDLARSLETRSRRLQEEVEMLSVPEIERRMEEIQATCESCHTRFRNLPAVSPP